VRRADRLFRIVDALRRKRRAVTARELARALEVSERTIYRDIDDLSRSGVPILGEAGVGYELRGYDLPPLMFSRDEIEALVFGARIVESWADNELAASARSVLSKVEAVVPETVGRYLEGTPLLAPKDHQRLVLPFDLADLRRAIRETRKIRLEYLDEQGNATRRIVRPLGLTFYGVVWLIVAWCELRKDFRVFRPDRVRSIRFLKTPFAEERGKTLRDFLTSTEDRYRARMSNTKE
jgi:predicted DNA-binding transcriptional regulator YafY